MKLDQLISRAANLSVEQVVGSGENIVATIVDDDLPDVLVQYERKDTGNTCLKVTMLVDGDFPERAGSRRLEICLYSDESLNAFFHLVDDLREMVRSNAAAPTPTSDLAAPF
jgi:hypothetical protein